MVNADHNAPSRQRHPKVAQLDTAKLTVNVRSQSGAGLVRMLQPWDEPNIYGLRVNTQFPEHLYKGPSPQFAWLYSEPPERLDAGLESEGIA